MELIQIIVTSLKLFVLVAAIVVLVSYFIYKVKDRKRSKPYTNIPAVDIVNQPIQFLQEPVENRIIERKPARFQVLNVENGPVEDEIILKKKVLPNYVPASSLKYKQPAIRDAFDIFERYSNSDFEPMHKVKL